MCRISQHMNVEKLCNITTAIRVVFLSESVSNLGTLLLHYCSLIRCCSCRPDLANQVSQSLWSRHHRNSTANIMGNILWSLDTPVLLICVRHHWPNTTSSCSLPCLAMVLAMLFLRPLGKYLQHQILEYLLSNDQESCDSLLCMHLCKGWAQFH